VGSRPGSDIDRYSPILMRVHLLLESGNLQREGLYLSRRDSLLTVCILQRSLDRASMRRWPLRPALCGPARATTGFARAQPRFGRHHSRVPHRAAEGEENARGTKKHKKLFPRSILVLLCRFCSFPEAVSATRHDIFTEDALACRMESR
jgi:hypothetical protein